MSYDKLEKMRKKSSSGGGSESFKAGRQIYQRGNQRESSPHYVFLYSEDDQSEDETEVFPLQRSKNFTKTFPRQIQVINVQVQSEDTLQALSLRYHCTISEIKRINNIHKDNEIHAYCSIKVPVKPYSLLTLENIDEKNEYNQANGLEFPASTQQIGDTTSQENKIINLLSVPSMATSNVEINQIILNSTVEPLSQIHNEPFQFTENTETDQLISSLEYNNANNSSNFVNTFKCSGADWGLSWYQLLCFSLLLGFAGPLIYVLYIAESPKHYNSS